MDINAFSSTFIDKVYLFMYACIFMSDYGGLFRFGDWLSVGVSEPF